MDSPPVGRTRMSVKGMFILRMMAGMAVAPLIAGCGGDDAGSSPSVTSATGDQQSIKDTEKALAAVDSYLLAEDLDAAEIIVARLVSQNPGHARAHEMFGRVLLARGIAVLNGGSTDAANPLELYQRAYEQYRLAIAAGPTVDLHQSAGSIASMAGQPQLALPHYLAAEKLEPLNPKPPLFAAQIEMQTGRIEAARAHLERVLAIDPNHAIAHASLASIWLRLYRNDMALLAIRAARAIEPGNMNFRITEANALRRLGHTQDALQNLLTLPPESRLTASATVIIAGCWSDQGDHAKAASAWSDRYRGNPSEPTIWRAAVAAGWSELAAGNRLDASSWLKQARLAAPDTPEVHTLADAVANAQ